MAWRFTRRQFLAAAGAASVGYAAEAQACKQDEFDTTELELHVRGIDPAHDGLRIAQLSDIHVGSATPDSRIIAARNAVNAARPDLVVLTGDYVTVSRKPIDRVGWLLAGLEAPTVAVLGNHDYWTDGERVRGELEQNRYCVLRNEATSLRVRGAPVHLFGVDDGRTRRDDVEATFKGAPAAGTRVVLAHTPPTADKLPAWSDLVCLSGHTHGGQLQLGGLTDGIGRRVGQPYMRGLYRVRGNLLYVNRGLGYGRGGPLVRIGTPPEVTFITLRLQA